MRSKNPGTVSAKTVSEFEGKQKQGSACISTLLWSIFKSKIPRKGAFSTLFKTIFWTPKQQRRGRFQHFLETFFTTFLDKVVHTGWSEIIGIFSNEIIGTIPDSTEIIGIFLLWFFCESSDFFGRTNPVYSNRIGFCPQKFGSNIPVVSVEKISIISDHPVKAVPWSKL